MAGNPDPGVPDSEVARQVDSILADSAALAAELGGEVGADLSPSAAREAEFFESQTDSEASLDTQLAQAEKALDDVAREVEGAQAEAPKRVLKLPAKRKSEPVPAPAPAPAPTLELPPDFADVAMGTIPSLDPELESPAARANPALDQMDDLVAASLSDLPFELDEPPPTRWATLRRRLGIDAVARVCSPLFDALAGVLEALDRPFAWVPSGVRSLLGWAAVLMLITSFWVLIFVIW